MLARKIAIAAANAVGIRACARLPGTEFLDAETKRQKWLFNSADGCRDQNPGNEWPKTPAKTPRLGSCQKPSVYEDWMVGAPGLEPGTR